MFVPPPQAQQSGMAGNMEVKCLQKNLDRLSKALDPKVIATSLFAKEMINQSAWDEARKDGPLYDRNLNLLAALMSSIQAQPSFLLTFCEILEKEVVTAELGAELRGKAEAFNTGRNHY